MTFKLGADYPNLVDHSNMYFLAGTLLNAGIPIIPALNETAAQFPAFAMIFDQMNHNVKRGKPISEGFESFYTGSLYDRIKKVLDEGESNGELPKAFISELGRYALLPQNLKRELNLTSLVENKKPVEEILKDENSLESKLIEHAIFFGNLSTLLEIGLDAKKACRMLRLKDYLPGLSSKIYSKMEFDSCSFSEALKRSEEFVNYEVQICRTAELIDSCFPSNQSSLGMMVDRVKSFSLGALDLLTTYERSDNGDYLEMLKNYAVKDKSLSNIVPSETSNIVRHIGTVQVM